MNSHKLDDNTQSPVELSKVVKLNFYIIILLTRRAVETKENFKERENYDNP